MEPRSKTVHVRGARYEVRRMTPTTAGFIWQKLMAAVWEGSRRNAAPAGQADKTMDVDAKEEASPPEARLRTTCALAFLYMPYGDFEFTQQASLKLVSRYQIMAGVEAPRPIMQDSGQWAELDIADDPALVTELVTEVLVYNLLGFLSQSGADKRTT